MTSIVTLAGAVAYILARVAGEPRWFSTGLAIVAMSAAMVIGIT